MINVQATTIDELVDALDPALLPKLLLAVAAELEDVSGGWIERSREEIKAGADEFRTVHEHFIELIISSMPPPTWKLASEMLKNSRICSPSSALTAITAKALNDTARDLAMDVLIAARKLWKFSNEIGAFD